MSSGSMSGDRTSSDQSSSETDVASSVTFSQGVRPLPRGLDEGGSVGAGETGSPNMTNSIWGEVDSSSLISKPENLAEGEMTYLDQHPVSTIPHPPGSRYGLTVEKITEEVSPGVPVALASSPSSCVADNRCPPHGMVSLCGRRREMEDAVAAVPNFMTLPCDVVGGCNCDSPSMSGFLSALHFFGVYDGHGGSQVCNVLCFFHIVFRLFFFCACYILTVQCFETIGSWCIVLKYILLEQRGVNIFIELLSLFLNIWSVSAFVMHVMSASNSVCIVRRFSI
jgi:hypothetical protein